MSDDEGPTAPAPQPVLRGSPSKRASYVERSPIQLEKPLEAESFIPLADFDREKEDRAQQERERTKAEEEKASVRLS